MVVFCEVWGIWWWRLTAWSVQASSLRVADRVSLSTFEQWRILHATADLIGHRQAQIERGIPSHVPMCMLVRGKAPSSMGYGMALCQWNGPVPYASLCRAGKNDLVCAPEFCFLQICAKVRRIVRERLDDRLYLVILAELGCELCGTYSRQDTPRGFRQRRHPLTSTASLLFFLGRMINSYGSRRMRETLPWIADCLASPMETALYFMLCLPRSVGGIGIMRPIINGSLPPSHLRHKTHNAHVIPGYCWPEARLVAEYDSDDSHQGRERKDAERRELLQDMGYVVVVFHSDDVMDRKRFNEKAQSLCMHLGQDPQEVMGAFEAAQATLHDMLLRHPRWI